MLQLSKQTTPSITPPPLLSLLQPTTNKINSCPSLYCHGKEIGSTFEIMKLLYDLALGEMIHICVLVEQCYYFVNWELITTPPPTKDSLKPVLSMDLLNLAFLISVNHNIALVVWSREPPFLFFLTEWTSSTARFSACLLYVVPIICFNIHMYPSR